MTFEEKLDKIRSPKLQNQKETAIVLSAVEATLKEQHHSQTPTGYFVALLALLTQAHLPNNGVANDHLASSVVYLLDLVIGHVPAAILRTKFSQILTYIAPVLTSEDATAPLLRSSIGCLESLLVAQDGAAWTLSQAQISPRRAMAGLLSLASDQRPKVRKRAQDAITQILKHPPPTPSLDHPVADMCAETAMRTLTDALAGASVSKRKSKDYMQEHNQPGLIHALQLVKAISLASGGWPSRKIEQLCEVLMGVSRSNNKYLTMAAFEVFEVMFQGMADQFSALKLPRLMEALSELKPSQNDSQLLPPWIAVISRAYDVSAQIDPQGTFHKLPELFDQVSEFLSSASHEIRVSASECLISFLINCVPDSVIAEPSITEGRTLEKVVCAAQDLLSIKFQAAWMEVFNVQAVLFEALRWRAIPLAQSIVATIGELRASESFNGKKEADVVLGKAIQSMGPEAVLGMLPLNLIRSQKGQPGRAWLLPLLRDNVMNTNLAHFRSEFVPLSEAMYQRVIDHGEAEKTMEVKIFETIVHQTWALFPGYANLPLDLVPAFDQEFAELLSNLLYSQPELRPDICRGLQTLVESNQEILAVDADEHENPKRSRVTKTSAQSNLDHLAVFAGNLLAVLFNVYTQTLPQFRGYILQCINAYLSITKERASTIRSFIIFRSYKQELLDTFMRVIEMFDTSLAETSIQPQPMKQQSKDTSSNQMPPTTHTLMDLIITLSIYLPLATFAQLFTLNSRILPLANDPQLQKKAYKLLPRLATSDNGALALGSRSKDLQSLLLTSAATASAPARRDRLLSLATIVYHLPKSDLHFIPATLSEAVIATKESNEKARSAAFDLLVLMGRKMGEGGTIEQSKIPHMDAEAPTVEASLEEFFTMVSAGLVGETPHMISASITALTRILYEFHKQLPQNVIEDLVSTLTLFLTSNNREVVRSCLGFTKVIVVSLPTEVVQPKLQALVPGVLGWSKEHKSRFRAKVKHIVERMIRRFGIREVEQWCPEDGKKLVQNIRKTKERKKRKKSEAAEETSEVGEVRKISRKGRFESEYEEAIYDSDDDEDSDIDCSDDDPAPKAKTKNQKAATTGRGTYITELPDDEPLDLLSANALSHISSSQPIQFKARTKTKAKVDLDGKLVFGNGNEKGQAKNNADQMAVDPRAGPGDGTLKGGINAYVEAIRGRDAVQRGRGGRLKFSNKRQRGGDEMDVDDEEATETRKQRTVSEALVKARGSEMNGGSRRIMTNRGGRGGASNGLVKNRFNPKTQRKGLGVQKVKGGRVGKTTAVRR
ncbi:MAG: hypothetical protein LQ337_003192 [Flavoplaca oasis]|nr:MAG: hypothetical protein LQ337_003192 [Flavoplaca oasis]